MKNENFFCRHVVSLTIIFRINVIDFCYASRRKRIVLFHVNQCLTYRRDELCYMEKIHSFVGVCVRKAHTFTSMHLKMHPQILSNIILSYFFAFLANSSAGANNRTALNGVKDKLPAGLTIENLQLGSANDRKTKTTRAPPVVAPTHPPPVVSEDDSSPIVYRLNANNGAACILISTDGLIDFDYDTTLGEKREKPIYLPDDFRTEGDCEKPDDAYIAVIWKGYKWSVYFSKTPGGEHWYISKMELVLDQTAVTKIFEHIKKAPREYKFTTPTDHTQMLFPTPVGKSYRCSEDIVIEMRDENLLAKLNLRQLKMQPFIFKKNDFGPEFVCTPGGAKSYRDETAPIAVGSTLAVVTLLTVTGYGVYRYMKVKKVQYDAME